MTVITVSIESINDLVVQLANQSQQITQSLREIEDISEQTKLLAGEHGKGFAVVAGEIRKLASNSQTSTIDIQRVLQNIDFQVHEMAEKTESGLNEIHKRNATIIINADLFHVILNTMKKVEDEMAFISNASQAVASYARHASETNTIFKSILESNHVSLERISVIANVAKDQDASTESLNQIIMNCTR